MAPVLLLPGDERPFDRGDAMDKLDTIRKLLAKAAGAATPAEAEAYVRRALTSQFLDDRRSASRWRGVEHLVASPDATPDDAPGRIDSRLDVVAALAALPPRPRTCLVLRYYADLTVPQIATELGIAEGSVKRYLHDGTAALGATLTPSSVEEA